jgi:hypothetical protein
MFIRLISIILYLTMLQSIKGFAQPAVPAKRTYGGTEFIFKHRPDISDTTYQLFFRKNLAWYRYSASGGGYLLGTNPNISLVDTCNYKYQPISFNLVDNNPLLSLNQFNGDSASKRIFPVCNSTFPDTVITPWGTSGGIIHSGFKDTFELIRDYWHDTIIHLPEKCGLWQVQQGALWLMPNDCGYTGSGLTPINVLHYSGTNIDTSLYVGYGSNKGYAHTGITQINTLLPNSSPYFLSYPTLVTVKNVSTFFAMNAVDPDGDSLSFSSVNMVFPDTVQGDHPASYFSPWVPFRQCVWYGPTYNDTTTTCFRTQKYNCIPGSGVLPNCVRYDAVYNPFDTDSTFLLNPATGDFSFTAKSAYQSAKLVIRCDEYRNGVWLGSVNRNIQVHVIDSMFYSQPSLRIDTANLVNCSFDSNYVFRACAGAPISIPFDALGINNVSQLKVRDNHNFSLGASSSVTYFNQASDSVRGVLLWTPPANASGWYNLLVTVKDSVCSMTPYLFEHPYLLRIWISEGVNAGRDTAICAGTSIQLQANVLGNNPATWSVLSGSANSLSCTNCNNPIATPAQTTTYVVQANLSGLSSCKQKDTITIVVQPDFSLNATDTLICAPLNQINLYAQPSVLPGALSFQWSPASGILGSSTQSQITITPSSTQYVVVASDTVGCFTHTDTSSIVYDPSFNPELLVSPSGSICTGDSVQLQITGGGSITWSPSYHISSLSDAVVWVWPDTTVTYLAEIVSANSACRESLTYTVPVIALRADAGLDQEIFDGEAVILGGPAMLCGAGCNLKWFPDQYLFFNYLMYPKAVPHETITYWVMLSNESGTCISRDSVTIRVKCTDIYMPNVFNPQAPQSEYTGNFGPRNVSIDLNYFRVFNRWGQLVFQTEDVSYRWDGKYKGEPQPAGTYVWVIEGKCPNGEWIRKSGNVLLVR